MNIAWKNASRIWNWMPLACFVALLAACSGQGNGGGNCDAYGGCSPPNTGTGVPSITVTSMPAPVSGSVTLSATPTVPNGGGNVTFLLDNVPINATPIAATSGVAATTSWNSVSATDGGHTITARVTDSRGLVANASTPVTVANSITMNVSLTPAEELPSNATTASGTGAVTVNLATGAVSGNITFTGVTVAAAHIHEAFAGDNGPIIVNMAANATIANRWDFPAGSVLTAPQLTSLQTGKLYLNAHSAAFPGGQLRTQLKPANIRVAYVTLTGAQEVPPVTTAATGVAAITVDYAARTVTAHVNTTGIGTVAAAHIHKGVPGVNGPVEIGFSANANTNNPNPAGHWSVELATTNGALTTPQPLTASDLDDLTTGGWYVNVHSVANPGGEIRGNVVAPIFLAALSSANEVPSPVVGYAGTVSVTYDPVTQESCVRGNVPVPVTDNITLSHIHSGAAGVNGPVIQNYGTNLANTCVTSSAAVFNQIIANPAGFYYNVHTTGYPGGAMRAQLTRGP